MNVACKPTLSVAAITVAIFLAAVSPGCSTPAPKADSYVAPPIGSTWVSHRRDTGSFGATSAQIAGKRGEQVYQGAPHITFEGADGSVLARPSGDWIGIFDGAKPVVTWEPPLGYRWPLVVGKTWANSYLQTIHATQQSQRIDATYWVEAYEDVTLPAGTFKTFRVKISDNMGNEGLYWFSPDLGIFVKQFMRRTDKHPQGAGTREQQLISQAIRK